MTLYSFSQLEQLWVDAGGPAAVESTAAAIALAESGGNPLAAYPQTTVAPGQGSTTDATGLWQILGLPAGNFTAAELTDPGSNAKMAVAKYQQAGNSFSPWQTYTTGEYEQFLPPGASATLTAQTALSGGSPPGQPAATPQTKSLVAQAGSAVTDAQDLLHGAAETLNWLWEWFEPGQGWRLAFGAGAVALGYLGLRQWGLVPSVSSIAKAA